MEEASRGDDQIVQYVRTLEEHYGEDMEEDEEDDQGAELPSADELLKDVEDFLRGSGDSG